MKNGMKKIIVLILVCFGLSITGIAQTKVIAHRGYWKTKGSAQNSIKALKNAAEIGVYGSEFDVWVTKDSVAVVNHDKDINGIVIEEATYEQIKREKLPNGEEISTLDEYLRQGAKYRKMKLVLELKDHHKEENDKKAVDVVIEEVKKSKAYRSGQIEFISFNFEMCKKFAREFPDITVSYLTGEKSPKALFKEGIDGIDYNKAVLSIAKGWIKEAHELGMVVNVWTVNDTTTIKKFGDWGVDFITTDEPELALEIL